ncbi:MAG: chemotaxis protein CheD [bacterium]
MKNIIVDIAGASLASEMDEVLVTYSLGSCLGVALYDPVLHLGGMAHCMLPLSQIDPHKSQEKPFMFVDVGIPRLLDELFIRGSRKKDLIVRVAGGASIMDSTNLFRIGERNQAIFRKIMWKNGLLIKSEDVGGEQSRTLRLEIATGRLIVRSGGVERDL